MGVDRKLVVRLALVVSLSPLQVSAQTPPATQGPTPAAQSPPEPEGWAALEPGQGFQVAKTERGDLWISAYGLFRYLNQLPADQTFVDHLGRERTIDTRNDVQWHRVQAFLKGWVYNPRLRYTVNFWTVNATGQVALAGMLRFRVNPSINLGFGVNGMPGTRSLGGSHPYWLAHDRVMADEFFRPGFTSAAWVEGQVIPRLFYNVMVGTNLSELGISAGEDTRDLATGSSVWRMPTTGEFGPRGGFGDYEVHEKLATRFGFSTVRSREDRFSQQSSTPENTTIRMQDSINLFEAGSLAEGVVVQRATYRVLSIDAGMKYRGFFLGTEFHHRWLDDFEASGPLPVTSVFDHGFYVQGSYIFKPVNVEVYASTSYVFGDKDAGYSTSDERIVGVNFFPFNTRNVKVNTQLIDIDGSPVNSVFGYYVGGQHGKTLSMDFSVLF